MPRNSAQHTRNVRSGTPMAEQSAGMFNCGLPTVGGQRILEPNHDIGVVPPRSWIAVGIVGRQATA
jgi:hypothetical protein